MFRSLKNFFRDLPHDGSLTLNGFMEYSQQVVNYRQGLCDDVPDDPMMLYLWSLDEGIPAGGHARTGRPPDEQALTLRRMGYNLVLNVFMRDIFEVVQLLKAAGLIGDKESANQEEATIIGNAYSLLSARDLSFYTDDQSRRVFYPVIMGEEIDMLTPPLGHDQFDRRLDAILARFQGVVKDSGRSSTGKSLRPCQMGDNILSRIQGALLGFACGDALGATTEFMSPADIMREIGVHRDITGGGWLELEPGEVTDDTEMTLCVARSLVECRGFDLQDIAGRFVEWYNCDPVDIGSTCRAGIHRYIRSGRLEADKR